MVEGARRTGRASGRRGGIARGAAGPRRSIGRPATISGLLLLLAACASTGGVGPSGKLLTERDLSHVPHQMLYELLRNHPLIRMQGTGGGEQIYVEDRTAWGVTPGSRWRPALLYVNDSRALDPVPRVRELRVDEIRRLEILTSTEASARFGGHGYDPCIAVYLK